MAFLKNTFNLLTDKRDIKQPIVYKDFNERDTLFQNLEALKSSNDTEIDLKKVENHLKLFSIGQTGEKSVFFELKNTMLPLIILHDVNIQYEDYHAQLDFVVITHKFILILEVKKLFGDVKVTDKGEFQRIIKKYNRVVNKEGMYSPINQVERHAEVLGKYLEKAGLIKKCPIRYAVTFANPKTILEISKKAPVDIQSRVIRHDQIKAFMKEELKKESPVFMLDNKLYTIANSLMKNNIEKPFNKEEYTIKGVPDKTPILEDTATKNIDQIRNELTDFRLIRSRELDVKPYYIFTNKTLDAIIENKPKTMEELLKVQGIGPKKAEEFGRDILAILRGKN